MFIYPNTLFLQILVTNLIILIDLFYLTLILPDTLTEGFLYLHDAVPVVSGGDLEEGEKGHTKVLEGGVPAHALTRVVSITH